MKEQAATRARSVAIGGIRGGHKRRKIETGVPHAVVDRGPVAPAASRRRRSSSVLTRSTEAATRSSSACALDRCVPDFRPRPHPHSCGVGVVGSHLLCHGLGGEPCLPRHRQGCPTPRRCSVGHDRHHDEPCDVDGTRAAPMVPVRGSSRSCRKGSRAGRSPPSGVARPFEADRSTPTDLTANERQLPGKQPVV